MSAGAPVYVMMNRRDQFDIVVISLMDLLLKSLIQRNSGNRSRVDRYTRIHSLLMDLEQTRYVGAISEAMGNKADKFNRLINSDLDALAALIKE